MRRFIGVLMALAVSANGGVIERSAGEKVLLPCYCPGRNQSEEFKWQKNSDGHDVKVINKTYTGHGYEGRALFVNGSDNCSLRLSNLNAKDTGEYRCIFYIGKRYNSIPTQLKVSGSTKESYQGPQNGRIRFFKMIPTVLLLGFCLFCGAVVRE